MARRANIVRINEDIILIDDAGDSTCYLVTGKERALLIDTANGQENLGEIVGELTELPVTVVNTHGHIDHIYGNVFFEEAWMHPADFRLHDEHFRLPEGEELKHRGWNPADCCPWKMIRSLTLAVSIWRSSRFPAIPRAALLCYAGSIGFYSPGTRSTAIFGCSWRNPAP